MQLDDAAVREILANLLDNARRHAAARITVEIVPQHDGVDVRVGDDGSGVPEEQAGSIFER